GGEEPRGGNVRSIERAQPRGITRGLFLHDAEGALLPEEVGQPFSRLRGGGNRQLPELHQEPKSFLIRSTNEVCRGPSCCSEAFRYCWRSSRCRAVSLVGTSTTTWYTESP